MRSYDGAVSSRSVGMLVVVGGLVLVGVGALIATGALDWFGRLPGDIRIESERTRIYVPITSTLIASGALSVVLTLVRRFLG